jgi:hypothetical protein
LKTILPFDRSDNWRNKARPDRQENERGREEENRNRGQMTFDAAGLTMRVRPAHVKEAAD